MRVPGSLRELHCALASRLRSTYACQALSLWISTVKWPQVLYSADLADATPAIVSQRAADSLGGLFKDISQLTFDVDVMAESVGPISIDRTRSRLTDRGNDRSESGMV